MWKKSGAWFYKELPDYVIPESSEVRSPPAARNWQHHTKSSPSNNFPYQKCRPSASASDSTRFFLFILFFKIIRMNMHK